MSTESATPPMTYVKICEHEGAEPIEVPTDEENRLLIRTIKMFYPDAVGLRYATPHGTMRILGTDLEFTYFFPPELGYQDNIFYLVFPKKAPSTVSKDSKASVEEKTDNLNQIWKTKKLWKFDVLGWIYYKQEGLLKNCIVVLSKDTAATFYHGSHKTFVENVTTFDIIPIEEPIKTISVVVVKIIPSLDCVLLRPKEGEFPSAPRIQRPEAGMEFTVIGFGHFEQECETYTPGIIFTETAYLYKNQDGSSMGPFWLGTAKTSRGDSGGACISPDGLLIGMNIATTTMPDCEHSKAIAKAAMFSPKNVLLGADLLAYERVMIEPNKPNPPERRDEEIRIQIE